MTILIVKNFLKFNVESLLIALIIIFSVSSGWLYVDYKGHSLNYDFLIRGTILTLVLLIVVLLNIFKSSRLAILNIYVVPLIIYIVYILIVSILKGNLLNSVPSLIRLSTYILFFLLCTNVSFTTKRVFWLLSFYFVIEGFLSYYLFDAGMFLNSMWRLGGPLGSANGYAALFYIIYFGGLYFVLCGNKSFLPICIFSLVLISFTGSRSILASVVILTILVLFLLNNIALKLFLCGIVIFLLLIFLYFIEIFSIYNRFSFLITNESDSSSVFRKYIFNTYFDNISLNEIIFGLGLNGFPKWFEIKTGYEGVSPHFEWLAIFAEGGVIGTIIYSMFLILVCCKIKKLFKLKIFSFFEAKNFVRITIITAPLISFSLLNPFYFIGPMLFWVYIVALLFNEKQYG